MRTPEDLLNDDVVPEPPKRGFFSKLFRKKEKPVDPLNMDREMQEYFKQFVEQKKLEQKVAASTPPRSPVAQSHMRPRIAHTNVSHTQQSATAPQVVATQTQHTQPTIQEPELEQQLVEEEAQRFVSPINDIKEVNLKAEPKVEVAAIQKEVVEIQKKRIDLHSVAEKVALALAFIVGLLGANLLWNQLPNNPMVVVGVVAISASAGVITSMSR